MNYDWSKYEMLGEFMETIEQMKPIDPDPKNVRCCFFFDN
jgi:hypothetical protein